MGILGITFRNFSSGNLTRFDSYLADFPQFEAIEMANCKGGIREGEIWEILKKVGKDKSPGINGLPSKVYLRLLSMFPPVFGIAIQSLDGTGDNSPLFSS